MKGSTLTQPSAPTLIFIFLTEKVFKAIKTAKKVIFQNLKKDGLLEPQRTLAQPV